MKQSFGEPTGKNRRRRAPGARRVEASDSFDGSILDDTSQNLSHSYDETTAEGNGSPRPAWGRGNPLSAARTICLRLLERRPRTAFELREAMAKKEIPEDVAEVMIARLVKAKLVDDAAFARGWVESRHRGKGLAKRNLSRELQQRGIPDHLIEEAIEDLPADKERDTAHELVRRRIARMAGLAPEVQTRRLLGFLARKGYGGEIAYGIVRQAVQEQSESDITQ
ncbi:MAG: regulatory protein RecX [Corynebacteriales bacterium]|nr:regulatory protein RecX [Mycobacteriales bacterium]